MSQSVQELCHDIMVLLWQARQVRAASSYILVVLAVLGLVSKSYSLAPTSNDGNLTSNVGKLLDDL